MVPRVAMFTTAGDTFLIIGARVGTGVSPTAGGMPARSGASGTSARVNVRARTKRFMLREF